MQREIKFRAWIDPYGNNEPMMVYMQPTGIQKFDYELGFALSFSVDGYSDFWAHENYERDKSKDILMQYTGLKDKNGKEIYEGDIVSYYQPFAKRTDTHIVKWDDCWACFGLFENGNKWCKENDWMKIQDIVIIGNIHENPELLNP